jgi:hypothetical protein
MAYFIYRNRPVSKVKWARSESTEDDDIVEFVAVRLPSFFSILNNEWLTTKIKKMARLKCCDTTCDETAIALISAGNVKARLTTSYGSEWGKA